MSLINEALIKAERERAEEAAARAAGFPVEHPKYRAEKRRHSRQLQSVPLAVINTAVLLACFAVIILIVVRNRPAADSASLASSTSADPSPASAAAPRSTFAPSEIPETSLPSDSASERSPDSASESPFVAAEPLPESASPVSADFELVGMSALGNNTLLGITRRSDQRSVWVPVGKSVAGITAVSYDPDADRAVIRVNGREHTLGLRTGSSIAAE